VAKALGAQEVQRSMGNRPRLRRALPARIQPAPTDAPWHRTASRRRTSARTQSDDPLAMYLMDIFTLSTKLAGLPGLSVPTPLHDDGLPVGCS
jgi:Asp-tRNA(Asn)/Glu-tRNA(Gln) amidotransferase A subunit family amidase